MATTRPKKRPEGSPFRGSPWTLIGPGCLVKGDLLLSGDVLIYGRVEGMVFTDGNVWVSRDGEVLGGVHARRVVVEGHCRGRIEGVEATALRAGSEVHAEIITPTLDVDPMARFIQERVPHRRAAAPDILPFRAGSEGKA